MISNVNNSEPKVRMFRPLRCDLPMEAQGYFVPKTDLDINKEIGTIKTPSGNSGGANSTSWAVKWEPAKL